MVARTQWGMFDRLFVITAGFGGNKEIPCHTGFVEQTKDNFPHDDPVNHRLQACLTSIVQASVLTFAVREKGTYSTVYTWRKLRLGVYSHWL
jgi:hypothetical protein